MKQHFKASLESGGANGAWQLLVVPFDVEREFSASGRLPVRGTINGHEFRSSILPVKNGRYVMHVDREMMRGARLEADADVLDVVMDFDDGSRAFQVPPQLREALSEDPAAQRRYAELEVDRQSSFAHWVGEAQHRETKVLRAVKAVEMIKSGERL